MGGWSECGWAVDGFAVLCPPARQAVRPPALRCIPLLSRTATGARQAPPHASTLLAASSHHHEAASSHHHEAALRTLVSEPDAIPPMHATDVPYTLPCTTLPHTRSQASITLLFPLALISCRYPASPATQLRPPALCRAPSVLGLRPPQPTAYGRSHSAPGDPNPSPALSRPRHPFRILRVPLTSPCAQFTPSGL